MVELARTLEYQRLQRAELLETRRRIGVEEMESHRWAVLARDSSAAQSVVHTEGQIAKDAIALLENEMRRI
jgi:hypothetical protein